MKWYQESQKHVTLQIDKYFKHLLINFGPFVRKGKYDIHLLNMDELIFVLVQTHLFYCLTVITFNFHYVKLLLSCYYIHIKIEYSLWTKYNNKCNIFVLNNLLQIQILKVREKQQKGKLLYSIDFICWPLEL